MDVRSRVRHLTLCALLLAWMMTPAIIPGGGVLAWQGSVYYVAPTGLDSNPGTQALPWQTIQKAADTLAAGDTVYIRAGTYRERVVPQNSGSDSEHYITYAAYPRELVVIDGARLTVPVDEGLFYVLSQSYVRISGLRVVNSAYAGVHIDRSSHILVEKNYIYNSASSGIGVWGSRDITVEGNEVELACWNGWQESLTMADTDTFEVVNNRVHNGAAGYNKEGICIKDGARNGRVYRNLVHHTEAVGIYVDASDAPTANIDVFQNIVHDISASGISLASEVGGLLEHIRVYNNIIYHNRTVGIWLSGCCPGVASHPMSDLRIINNTLYNNGWEPWGGGIGLDNNADMRQVIIRNNICSQNLSFQIAVDAAVPTQTLMVDHNLIDGYRGGEGEIYGADYIEGDPLFVNPAGANFHLQPNSPAIDRGSPVDAPSDDFDGVPRPQDGQGDHIAAFDIGAYELGRWRVHLPVVV